MIDCDIDSIYKKLIFKYKICPSCIRGMIDMQFYISNILKKKYE